jgi:hypothetical protein
MHFEKPAPRLPVEKLGRGAQSTHESANKPFRFGEEALAVLKIRQ